MSTPCLVLIILPSVGVYHCTALHTREGTILHQISSSYYHGASYSLISICYTSGILWAALLYYHLSQGNIFCIYTEEITHDQERKDSMRNVIQLLRKIRLQSFQLTSLAYKIFFLSNFSFHICLNCFCNDPFIHLDYILAIVYFTRV